MSGGANFTGSAGGAPQAKTGIYNGTNSGPPTQTINLGFTPKLVTIFQNNVTGVQLVISRGNLDTLCTINATTGTTQDATTLTFTATGFTVKDQANDDGTPFSYTAVG